jgi:hypothetical protein
MNLKELITTEETNLIELYFTPDTIEKDSPIIDLEWTTLPNIPLNLFKNRFDQLLVEYSHKNLTYQYDISNDFQKVFQRNCINDKIYNKEYIQVIQEENLPTHRFPCSIELNSKIKYNKIQYKYNNRIFLTIEVSEDDKYIIYLKYNHVKNIDIEKMNEEFNEIYKKISKSICNIKI